MANICTTYLCKYRPIVRLHRKDQNSIGYTNDRLREVGLHDVDEQEKFWSYCAEYWTSHLQDRAMVGDYKLLGKALTLYDAHTHLYRPWFPVLWRAMMPFEQNPTLPAQHIIAFNGHASVLDRVYEQHRFNLDLQDSTGRSA